MLWQRSFSLIALLCISACGFEPLYKQQLRDNPPISQTTNKEATDVSSKLGSIDVVPITYFGRPGQELTIRLENILKTNDVSAPPLYKLAIAVSKEREALLVERDAEITRYRLITTSHIKLISRETGLVVFDDTIRLTSSFDAVQSDFATYIAEQSALSNLMQQMATRIRFQLTDYFLSQKQ